MALVRITVCDVCEDRHKPVRSYRITSEGRVKGLHLCADHGKSLEELLGGDSSGAPRRGGRRGRRGQQSDVVTLDEIEEKKRK